MNKKIIAILLTVMMAGLITAGCDEVVAGNSCSFKIKGLNPNENIGYTVVDNSSNMKGMNVSINGSKVTLDFDKRYKPDEFALVFFNQQKEVVHKHHYHTDTETEIEYKNNTEIVINEKEKPYCNDSCCPEPEKPEPEVITKTEIIEEYWQEALLSLALLVSVFFLVREIKLRKSRNNSQNVRR